MFRIIFLGACMLYIGFMSLFNHTSETIIGQRHLFGYTNLIIILGAGFNIIPLASAWFFWRVKKDKWGTIIMLLAVPFFGGFVMPQYFMEKVEVTPEQIIHRREPPHTRFNIDLAFDSIASGTKLNYKKGTSGYNFILKDNKHVELPANTVLTAATKVIDEQLQLHKIPMETHEIVSNKD
jgi:hypothetical protein